MTNYTTDVQRIFIEFMLSDAVSYARVQNIFNPDNFDKSLKHAARFVKEYAEKYKCLPTVDQCNASEGTHLKIIADIHEQYTDWFLTEFEQFTKRQELERAILLAADMLEKGEYDPVEKLIKDAVQISLTRDLGLDYFESPKLRLQQIRLNNGDMSTGMPDLDKKLFGGWSRGTLNIVAGQSGSGKSLFLQNWSVNLITQSFNGVYITLELSEELCSLRLDAMVTGVSTRDVFKNLDDTELRIKSFGRKAGGLQVKYLPAQRTANDVRAYLRELEISQQRKLDFVCVDYLDLLMPVSVKVSPSDLYVKDKYVAEELRNLAKEFNVVMLTASQLNRSSVDEVEFNHSHISGGISKINTADNVFGIFTSRAMRERGRYQLQLLKTRSSSGVGQHVDLEFNVESLRITGVTDESPLGGISPNAISNQIKPRSTVTEVVDKGTGEVSSVTAIDPGIPRQAQETSLKDMLNSIKRNQ